MCTRGRYVSRNPLSTEFRSIYKFTLCSPSLTIHRLHLSFSFVFLFSEPDAGASIALDCFTDVSPQSKRESLSLRSAPWNSCMVDVKMKNMFSGKTMDAFVLRSCRHRAGLWPNAGNQFCDMYKETDADTHTGIPREGSYCLLLIYCWCTNP